MRIRQPAVAGRFYPANQRELESMISAYLAKAHPDISQPEALIVPHAGYVYSGLTAAWAYASLRERSIRQVVLFGPAHRVPFDGLALPSADAFATPLGEVRLDQRAMQQALTLPDVISFDAAHALEHSLEVQLPFLQTVLDDFTLLPFCVGRAEIDSVARVIRQFQGDAETLILISSDLSHFHPYEQARRMDQQSIADILTMHGSLTHEQACGATPINGLLRALADRPLAAHLLDYRNSGDTAGDKFRVVGYASVAFTQGGKHE